MALNLVISSNFNKYINTYQGPQKNIEPWCYSRQMKPENDGTRMNHESLFDLQTKSQKSAEYLEHAKCKEGKTCTHLCFSEHCKSQAAICADMSCDCQSQHDQGQPCLIKKLSAVVKMIQSKRQSFPDLLKWINDKYDELIDWISEQREKVYIETKLAGLTEAQMSFLTTVYTGKCEELTGKKVHEVVKDLHTEKKKFDKTDKLMIDRISQEWKLVAEKIQKEVSTINRFIADARKQEFSGHQIKIDFDSKVVSTETQKQTVTEMLNDNNRKVLRYELLYRASENNFDTYKFWEKCNHKADTVTLIHTEFDKVIGGYTPLSWKKEKHNSWEEDSSLRSFVFSVTEKTKSALKESEKGNAISHYTNYGPRFGGGCDIYIFKNANSNNSSSANIGHSYENSKVQYNTKEAWQFFQGSTENFHFKIKEWEVWQVIFN